MNNAQPSQTVGRGCVLMLGVGILLFGVGTDCKQRVQFDEKQQQTIIHTIGKVLIQLNDAVSQNPEYTATLSTILSDIKSALGHVHMTPSKVNWFMQCLNNCLHLYDDKRGADLNTGLLGVSGNMSVEQLYKCNHYCVNVGTGNPDFVGR